MEALDAILARLFKLHRDKIELSLGRINRLLDALGSPHERLPRIIHVAGTNGKGSTIAFLRAMLEAAGRSVHVYTSPHLVRFHERIRLGSPGGGKLVDDQSLFNALQTVEEVNKGQEITFFEATTAAAFKIFSENSADYLLLEVGLGGRFDATNVIKSPLATVITPVSLDHCEFLGETVDKIAFEKAGIMKRSGPAIIAQQQLDALNVIVKQADTIGIPIRVAGQHFYSAEEQGRLIFRDETGLLDLPLPRLCGRHQHINASTAIAALRQIEPELPHEIFERGLLEAEWPARLQNIIKGKILSFAPKDAEIWLDGGHNEEGGYILGQAMADFEETRPRPLVVICGFLRSKDTNAFLKAFKGLAQEVIAVSIKTDQSLRTPAEIASIANILGLRAAACENVEAALRFLDARDWQIPPRILITGSLYLAGEVLELNGTYPQ